MTKKKTTPEGYKFPVDGFKSKWTYCVEYDSSYSEDPNCEHNYCSCQRFVSGIVKSVNYDSIYNQISGRSKITSVKDYCLDRWVRKCLAVKDFYCEGVGGYYGDETEVRLNDIKELYLKDFVTLLQTGTVAQAVEEILRQEYGYVLPELELENKNWTLYDKVELNLIHSAKLDENASAENMFIMNRELVEGYKKHLNTGYAKDKILTCMCIKQEGQYRVIDGNHRLTAAREVLSERLAEHKRGRKPQVYMSVVYCT